MVAITVSQRIAPYVDNKCWNRLSGWHLVEMSPSFDHLLVGFIGAESIIQADAMVLCTHGKDCVCFYGW